MAIYIYIYIYLYLGSISLLSTSLTLEPAFAAISFLSLQQNLYMPPMKPHPCTLPVKAGVVLDIINYYYQDAYNIIIVISKSKQKFIVSQTVVFVFPTSPLTATFN